MTQTLVLQVSEMYGLDTRGTSSRRTRSMLFTRLLGKRAQCTAMLELPQGATIEQYEALAEQLRTLVVVQSAHVEPRGHKSYELVVHSRQQLVTNRDRVTFIFSVRRLLTQMLQMKVRVENITIL